MARRARTTAAQSTPDADARKTTLADIIRSANDQYISIKKREADFPDRINRVETESVRVFAKYDSLLELDRTGVYERIAHLEQTFENYCGRFGALNADLHKLNREIEGALAELEKI